MSKLYRSIAWLQIGQLTTYALAFLLSAFLFRNLNGVHPELFGWYTALFLLFNSFGIFLFFDPGNALINLLAKTSSKDAKANYCMQGWTFSIGSAFLHGSLFFLLGNYFCGDLNSPMHDAIIWMTPIPFLNAPIQWGLNLLQGHEKMKEASVLMTLHNLARPVGGVFGWLITIELQCHTPGGILKTMVQSIVIAHAIVAILSLRIVAKSFPWILKGASRNLLTLPNRKLFLDSLLLSSDKKIADQFELLPGQLLWLLSNDVIVLGHFRIITSLFDAVQGVISPISRALLPRLSIIQSVESLSAVRTRVNKVISRGFALGVCLSICVALGAHYIAFPHPWLYAMDSITASKIESAGWVLLLLFPFFGYGVTNNILSILLGKIRALLFLKLTLMALFVPGGYLLISHMSLAGACIYIFFYRATLRLLGAWYLHRELNRRCDAN